MKIKTKILCALLGMSLLIAFLGGLTVNRQQALLTTLAATDAEDVARILGFLYRGFKPGSFLRAGRSCATP